MIEFISKNFVFIITVSLFLIFALIGFLVDTSRKSKELYNEQNNEENISNEEMPKEKLDIPIDLIAEEKKAGNKKEKEEKNINQDNK